MIIKKYFYSFIFIFIQVGGRAVLVGVVSWGLECGRPQWPGVYSRVGSVLSWLNSNIRDAEHCGEGPQIREPEPRPAVEYRDGRGDRRGRRRRLKRQVDRQAGLVHPLDRDCRLYTRCFCVFNYPPAFYFSRPVACLCSRSTWVKSKTRAWQLEFRA